MERPKIKDYCFKDTKLNEVAETYNKAPELFKYAQAVDRYADALEESLAKDGEALTLINVELKALMDKLSELQTTKKYIKQPCNKALHIVNVSGLLANCPNCGQELQLEVKEMTNNNFIKALQANNS